MHGQAAQLTPPPSAQLNGETQGATAGRSHTRRPPNFSVLLGQRLCGGEGPSDTQSAPSPCQRTSPPRFSTPRHGRKSERVDSKMWTFCDTSPPTRVRTQVVHVHTGHTARHHTITIVQIHQRLIGWPSWCLPRISSLGG